MKENKVVVFDLDETLGYFTELGVFIDALESMNGNKSIPRELFYNILDIFSFFLRPDILQILKYIMEKKQKGLCSKVILYTNNNGPRKWALSIKSYFEWKLKYKLFDRIISAYKIDNKQIEKCRTSYDKSYNDLLKCSRIPKRSKICFIDDYMHEKMINDNIYYIHLSPYKYKAKPKMLSDIFLKSKFGKYIEDKEHFANFIRNYMNNIMYIKSNQPLSKGSDEKREIIKHLHYFFYKF